MTRIDVHALPLLALLIAACGRATAAGGAGAPAPAAQSDDAAIAKARADSARYPYTAADVRFMQGMVGHHAQAIVMSGWAPTHGASPAVRTLAERIINAQRDEIATIQQWLRDRQKPVPEATPHGMHMSMGGMEHEMLMPGMLTEQQMAQLEQARGKEFDRLFLTYMIQHHRGAVEMVHELFATDGAAQDEGAFRLASDVQVDQITEISRMESMLARMRREGPQ